MPSQPNGANAAVVNFDLPERGAARDRDTSLLYIALAANPATAGAVGKAIDAKFANSTYETRTQSEGDLVSSQLQRIADIDLIVGGIIGAVFFALLLATGALMMQSIRERVPELAVLETLGFSDRQVMGLILTEAILFGVFSALVGLGLAAVIPAGSEVVHRPHRDAGHRVRGRCRVRDCAGGDRRLGAGMARPRLQVAEALAGR